MNDEWHTLGSFTCQARALASHCFSDRFRTYLPEMARMGKEQPLWGAGKGSGGAATTHRRGPASQAGDVVHRQNAPDGYNLVTKMQGASETPRPA